MQHIEVFSGERATGYDDFVTTWIPGYAYFVSLLPDLLLSQQVKEVLIVGCGTGNEMKVLAEASLEWHISGIDPSPEMVTQAASKLKDYSYTNVIQGVVSDLDDKKYDAATLLLVLHFLEDNGDKLALLKDIASRLKANAPLIVFDINGNQEKIKQNLSVLSSIIPKDLEPTEVAYRLNRLQNDIAYVSETRFIELCEEAGFKSPIRFFQSTIYKGWLLKKG